MPCTFSHPLAVVPLYRCCADRLNFAALVVGSMSPDFGYYVSQFPLATFAHTVLGLFAVCLPSGLAALGVFYLLRRPLCFVLPQPHRAALTRLAMRRWSITLRSLRTAALSILLGASTHTVWDSFTHDGGWAVERVAILRAPLAHMGPSTLPLSYVLQQTSTFGAGAFLAVLYFRWLRQQPRTKSPADTSVPDWWRYSLIAVLAVIAVAIAMPSAHRMASSFDGYLAFRVFVFRTGVYSAAAFLPLLIVSSIGFYVAHRRTGADEA